MKRLTNNRFLVIFTAFLVITGFMLSANPAEAGLLDKIRRMFERAERALFNSVMESSPDEDEAVDAREVLTLHRRLNRTYDNATNPEEIVREEGGTAADVKAAKKLERADDNCGDAHLACLDKCVGKYPESEERNRLYKCYKKCNNRMDKCNEPKVKFSN